MSVTYEWVAEALDGEDVIDTHHADTYAEVLAAAQREGAPFQIALVRDVHNSIDHALEDRAWAYVSEGRLPDTFDSGVRVPKRFHTEIAKAAGL